MGERPSFATWPMTAGEALYGLLGFLYRLGAQYAFISGVFPDERSTSAHW